MGCKVFSVFVIGLFLILSVGAQSQDSNYENIDEFLNEIPSINEELQSNEIILPDSAGFLINSGNILANISMNDNTSRNFYVTIADKKIKSISSGVPEKSNYILFTNEATINEILSSEDKGGAIMQNYDNKNIVLKGVGLGNKIKLFFAKIFIGFA